MLAAKVVPVAETRGARRDPRLHRPRRRAYKCSPRSANPRRTSRTGWAALFTFEDVAALEARALQTLLKSVETRELAVALKNADEQVLSKILGNLSERARESLLEEIDLLNSVRTAEIDAARKSIVQTARRLEEEGSRRSPFWTTSEPGASWRDSSSVGRA